MTEENITEELAREWQFEGWFKSINEGIPVTSLYERVAIHLRKQSKLIQLLMKDVERLDVLEKTHQDNIFSIGGTWYSRKKSGMPHTKHKTLRAAIDAVKDKP